MQKTDKKFSAFEIVVGLILIVYCTLMVIVFLWALNTSIKSDDNFLSDPRGLTSTFAFENYISAFKLKKNSFDNELQWKSSFDVAKLGNKYLLSNEEKIEKVYKRR